MHTGFEHLKDRYRNSSQADSRKLGLAVSLPLCTVGALHRSPPGLCAQSPPVHTINQWSSIGGLLFVAPELLFLYCVFWLGQHVYTRTCLHANDTQSAGSLTAVSAIFNFHFRFWSSSHFASCRSRLHENGCLLQKEKWTVKIGNSRRMD